jgi:hypothetical protein
MYNFANRRFLTYQQKYDEGPPGPNQNWNNNNNYPAKFKSGGCMFKVFFQLKNNNKNSLNFKNKSFFFF